jgi:short-subunit dehydrogenase
MKLKKLRYQVLVITGATSGIGLVTARMAARRGVRGLLLVGRNEPSLRELSAELEAAGTPTRYVVADVAKLSQLEMAAGEAIASFGGFDTWVNNAGVSIYGRLMDVDLADERRVFETNYWGLVNGCRVAVPHLRHRGGALINLGSTLSDRAIPLQGTYSASKHAVKGYTDALRVELEAENAPISVTLIKPSAIDTPYKHHAKNYLDVEPDNPPPVYAPEVVADAILHSATHQVRDMFVGIGGKMLSSLEKASPRLTDKYAEKVMLPNQRTEKPSRGKEKNALNSPGGTLDERGGYEGHVAEMSFYTSASKHPGASLAMALGISAGLAALLIARLGGRDTRAERGSPAA